MPEAAEIGGDLTGPVLGFAPTTQPSSGESRQWPTTSSRGWGVGLATADEAVWLEARRLQTRAAWRLPDARHGAVRADVLVFRHKRRPGQHGRGDDQPIGRVAVERPELRGLDGNGRRERQQFDMR